MVAILQ